MVGIPFVLFHACSPSRVAATVTLGMLHFAFISNRVFLAVNDGCRLGCIFPKGQLVALRPKRRSPSRRPCRAWPSIDQRRDPGRSSAAAQNPRLGRVLTMDALHSCPETARLVAALGADCSMPVKENRKTLLEDVELLDWDSAAEFTTSGKGHGWTEAQRCRAIPRPGAPDVPGTASSQT